MSWNATFEFILAYEQFRNIDLLDQGFYFLEFSIYSQDTTKRKHRATPYHFKPMNKIDLLSQKKKLTSAEQDEYRIDTNKHLFKSEVFIIRYCEEEIGLNEICCFRAEIPADNQYSQTEFFLEVSLNCKPTSDPQIQNLQLPLQGFETLSISTSIIRFASNGIHQFVPIVFDKDHFSSLSCTLHTLLLDFKFRSPEYLNSQLSSKRPKKIIKQNENLQSQDQQQEYKYKNIEHFIHEFTYGFQKESVQTFYRFYVTHIREVFSKLKRIVESHQDENIEPASEEIIQLPHPSLIQIKELDLESFESFHSISQFDDLNQQYTSTTSRFDSLPSTFMNRASLGGATQKRKKPNEFLTEIEQNIFVGDVQKEINQMSGLLFQLWSNLIEILVESHPTVFQIYFEKFAIQMKERWGESIFRQISHTSDIFTSPHSHIMQQETNNTISIQQRKKYYFNHLEPLPVENIMMFPDPENHPIFFEEILTNRIPSMVSNRSFFINPKLDNKSGTHLIVLCHGFQGNNYDLRIIRNNIMKQYGNVLCLSSRYNEGQTDRGIGLLGQNLALEIRAYIKKRGLFNIQKLSFIGHSMGGVIARAALLELTDYSSIMYSFISICSPHLGCNENSSKLIDAGLWIMQKIHNSLSLLQLQMKDANSVEDTFLYQLSKKPGLSWFTNVMFISSYDDQYVPTQSARIQTIKGEAQTDIYIILYQFFPKLIHCLSTNQISEHFNKMVQNIRNNFKCDNILRLDVNFKLESSIDRMIGRAAHIHFLESEAFSEMLVICYPQFFV